MLTETEKSLLILNHCQDIRLDFAGSGIKSSWSGFLCEEGEGEEFLFVDYLTFQQHASVSQDLPRQVYAEIEAALSRYLNQSQYTDTRRTSPM